MTEEMYNLRIEKIAEDAFNDELEKIATKWGDRYRAENIDARIIGSDKNKGRLGYHSATIGAGLTGVLAGHGIGKLVQHSGAGSLLGLGAGLGGIALADKLYSKNSNSDMAKASRSFRARKKARKKGEKLPELFRGAKSEHIGYKA